MRTLLVGTGVAPRNLIWAKLAKLDRWWAEIGVAFGSSFRAEYRTGSGVRNHPIQELSDEYGKPCIAC